MRVAAFLALLLSIEVIAISHQDLLHTPVAPRRLVRALQRSTAEAVASSHPIDAAFGLASEPYPAHYFDQLVSHDPQYPSTLPGATFRQRYWFDATYYRTGGPVILLGGGETDGSSRLNFMKTGILKILSEATGGMSVILEHRYYGDSFPVPVKKSSTVDQYRFLTTLQSLEDSVLFAQSIEFPGFEDVNLTSSAAAWIGYGGSYAGATSAFLRKLYPDVFWGALASSAVTTAMIDFSYYYEPIRLSAPAPCIENLISSTNIIDSLLSFSNAFLTNSLKTFFGLPNVTSDIDFVNALTIPLGSFQAKNWDDQLGSPAFDVFCDSIGDAQSEAIEVAAEEELQEGTIVRNQIVFASGDSGDLNLPEDPRRTFGQLSAYAAYIKEHVASLCPPEMTQDECFGTNDSGADSEDGDSASFLSWTFQVCTEWGYFMPAAPSHRPSLISRLITLDYTSQICRTGFPAGKLISIPSQPNVTKINQYGSFDLSYPRIAWIDGSNDVWLYATPHSPLAPNGGIRNDSVCEPFKLIEGGVHHWDENGRSKEPKEIRKIHGEEVEFVKAWMKQWREQGQSATHDILT